MSIRAIFLTESTLIFPFLTSVTVELQTMCHWNSLLSSGVRHSMFGICAHSNIKQLGGWTLMLADQLWLSCSIQFIQKVLDVQYCVL